MRKNSTAILIYKMLPKSLISRAFGYITRIPVPAFLLDPIIRAYSGKFGVRDEYIRPAGGFRNFDEFFTRRLRDGVHAVENGTFAVSPVDGRIDQSGEIRDAAIVQAKGIDYLLTDLLPSDTSRSFAGGSFMTIYLSPGDYHRIHSPVTGTITGWFNIPGALFSVQESMVLGLPGLFVNNERIVTYIETGAGLAAVCKVGALNVGRISLSYYDLHTNRLFRRRKEFFFDGSDRVPVRAGDELGIFHLGSTVILLFQKGMVRLDAFNPGDRIRMGARIGALAGGKK